MDMTKKLKFAMIELKVTQLQLAERLGQSQANMSRIMTANNYRVKDFEKIVHALGCELEVNIILPNGQKL
jgi:DNA-binding Xre family transcriptional regulator